MWAGRSLARSFFRLQGVFRWRSFSVASATEVLSQSLPQARLTVSRLARVGWLARVARGSYVALDTRWALERPVPDPLAPFRGESYYPTLIGATAAALQFYGARLRGLALFGSAARRTPSADSDLDFLLIADPLPAAMGDRLDELRDIRRDLRRHYTVASDGHLVWHEAQFVPMTPQELLAEPAILLDMTQDAVILFDPSGIVAGVLTQLTSKLRARGARRVMPLDGIPYWQLSPGARLGEVQDL